MRRARRLIALLALIAALALPAAAQAAPRIDEPPAIRVYLLGTGGPELSPGRAGYATLVEANGQLLLFDAGRDVLQRLYESHINPRRVTTVFLTHLHSDHIEGLPGLWMTPWFLLGRTAPLSLYGPTGTAEMAAGMRAMFAHDVRARVNPFNAAAGIATDVHEIAPGVVYDQGGVRVTAFLVEHADGDPAFGYRIEAAGRSVVLSGDTTRDAHVQAAATNADLLVHNVIAMSPRLSALPEMQGVLAKLTTPDQAAGLFAAARPRLVVYSHIVKKELSGPAGDAAVLARTRAAGYAGPLQIAQDRMVVEIGAAIRVIPPGPTGDLPDLDSKTAAF
jgi:ribonuclease Z